jgi:transcriptional regulator with XRE-family HTH domain
MLMHLIFTFESLNVLNSPGECMRYYRQLRGLTTRQLAEKLNIVPATVLGYEQGRFPITYEITVATTKMLQIPESLLFDDYCVFISAPYTELLHTVRKRYGLNQADFAEKACISPSIYAKWESGSRRPSRKMYQQLKVIYPEI